MLELTRIRSRRRSLALVAALWPSRPSREPVP